MSLSREELETLYRKESRGRLRERLLLVLKVDGDGMIPAHVAKEPTEVEHGLPTGLQDIIKKVLMD